MISKDRMTTLKQKIIGFCSEIGSDRMLVQGAGGNVSWKDEATLWIKASGTWLADADEADIFVPVDLISLQKAVNEGDFAVVPTVAGDSVLRPSIETMLHALMPHPVVVHVHAIDPLVHLVRKNPQNKLEELLLDDVSWMMIDYHKPGVSLARAVAKAISEKADVQVLLLKNHGVVLGGGTVEEIKSLLSLLLSRLQVEPAFEEIATKLPKSLNVNGYRYDPVSNIRLQNLALHPELYVRLRTDWVLYPDHVVFLGPSASCFESQQELAEKISTEEAPDLIFVRDLGVFSNTTLSKAKIEQLDCYFDVIIRQPQEYELDCLMETHIADLLNWDAERYRQQLAKS
jgi:rhamnose utilization protein RhaD (predicted bifunctional aldolase and dehydrogenase)